MKCNESAIEYAQRMDNYTGRICIRNLQEGRMSNTIQAIINLVTDPQLELGDYYNQRHRANSLGQSLEEYIKDLYAGTLRETDEQKRLKKIADIFSYLGNDSNPPDAMLHGGDAIEVKKLEYIKGQIQLNSSHPKCKLNSDSPMITAACRDAENGWTEKDLLYIVGTVQKKKLRSLFMVYGADYAATEETYLKIKKKIKEGVESIEGVSFTETNEMGRVNGVDPLKITDLRVRGMWILQNPWNAFSYLTQVNSKKEFEFCAIINKKKYLSFEEHEQLESLRDTVKGLKVSDANIKNPNNPAKLIEAKIIRFSIE